MEAKKLLATILLVLIGVPFCIYTIADTIKGYIPPNDARIKTPHQFEAAFNAEMAQYGMSIDFSGANYGFGKSGVEKTVSVRCEDGSDIRCRYISTSTRRKSIIMQIEFQQTIRDNTTETDYTQPLLEVLLRIFETPLYEDKDAVIDELSYNDTLAAYEKLSQSAYYPRSYINVSSRIGEIDTIFCEKTASATDGQLTLLIGLELLMSYDALGIY